MQITALEQLKTEMQEEMFQQSVNNTQLHAVNQNLSAQLSKADEKNSALEGTVAALNEEKVKVGLDPEPSSFTHQTHNEHLHDCDHVSAAATDDTDSDNDHEHDHTF